MKKSIIREYKTEEINAMNYILGKDKNNKIFTKFELEKMNEIDLFDKQMVEMFKQIWDNKENPERIRKFIAIINEGRCPECM